MAMEKENDDMNLCLKSNMLQLIQVVFVIASIVQAICLKMLYVQLNVNLKK